LDIEPCELCHRLGGHPLWRDEFCRVVLVEDRDYPGFCRVILERHVAEMTDLAPGERMRLMDAVFATEAALREVLRPHKINIASLGNVTPHLHWHVVPRHSEDRHRGADRRLDVRVLDVLRGQRADVHRELDRRPG